MAMQRFFEFFRRKITAHYGTIYLISFTKSSLRSSAMRVKFSQTYKKNNFFIWGRLFFSSSLSCYVARVIKKIFIYLSYLFLFIDSTKPKYYNATILTFGKATIFAFRKSYI